MNKQEILQLFNRYYGNKYKIYPNSIKSTKENYFLLVKDNQSKYLAVLCEPEKYKNSRDLI